MEFDAAELLFRRLRKDQLVGDQIAASAMSFPKQATGSKPSVNRSRFSRPQDALWTETEYLEKMGVFSFPVGCLGPELVCPDTGNRYECFARHVPLDKNYAHSEVWADTVPRSAEGYSYPSSKVRLEIRARIQKNQQIHIFPKA